MVNTNRKERIDSIAGTKTGGQRAAQTNKRKYGEDFYKRLGAMGGGKSRTGGFGCQTVGADGLTGKQRARIAGAQGGRSSRKPKQTGRKYEVQAAKSMDGIRRPLKINVVQL